MMEKLWVVLLVALTGAHLGLGSPVRSTPHSYPHNPNSPIPEGWWDSSLYAAVPAVALVVTAAVLLIGCTWCYRHKDCKQNEGADNQLFTASATHLHERRSQPPDSGFSEPANNNISEDNNNGPISLREMQNIANNNAAAYIVSENEQRNRVSRESVVEFEPLPGIRVADPLERCVDWFGDEDFPRNRLQYLREIGRGWFGRVVEGEIEDEGVTTTVAVKILNQNATLEDKARFLDEARLYRDSRHENVLGFIASCLQEDPWILIFELCSTDLQSYLSSNRDQMEALDAAGVPLRLMCDVTAALAHLHASGRALGELCTSNTLIRGEGADARAVLGHYGLEPRPAVAAPPSIENDVHALGTLMWDVCAWGAPAPDLSCRYRDHLYQVMQLCWITEPASRPSAPQVLALLNHLHSTHVRSLEAAGDDGYGTSDFEDRWQRLKPNTIPKVDEHVAIVHAPSTSTSSRFTEHFEPTPHSLAVDVESTASRSSSVVSDKHLLRTKSASLNNLHGSLEDFHTCSDPDTLDESKEVDRSDASVDPWLADIVAGSQDDVNYYRVVSDVIKNLDSILNEENTSSESSHQASPSRDNLSLDCKKDYPAQSSMVKSPGISNFQNILEAGFEDKPPEKRNEEEDRDTIGTLSHSFERHSDTTSQATLENLTPDTPIKDMELPIEEVNDDIDKLDRVVEVEVDLELPKENKIDNSDSVLPNLTDLCIAPLPSVNEPKSVVNVSEDCQSPGDNKLNVNMRDKESVGAKSISEVIKEPIKSECVDVIAKNISSLEEQSAPVNVQSRDVLPEVTRNEETKNMLPSATLSESNAAELRPEPTSTCSQNEINNDLIKPAESTTDRNLTNVESVSSKTETLDSNVNLLENVSEISIEPTPSLIETKEEKSPLYNGTNEVILPDAVQNESTRIVKPVTHDRGDKGIIQNNMEVSSLPDSDQQVLASIHPEEQLNFLTKEDDIDLVKVQNKLATPTLVLTDPRDEVISPTNIDKVSEAFVEKIIKDAETAALIETVHTKVVEPVLDSKKKNECNDFLENEIKFLERSSLNEFPLALEFADKPVQIRAPQDPLSMILREEIKETPIEAVNDTEVEDIAKKILNDAIQDVPKAMEKIDAVHFFLKEDKIEDQETEKLNKHLQILKTEGSEPVRENLESTKSRIFQKENNITITDQVLDTVSVLPQTSLDLDSTASADSSQSTFLIRDTLKEESNTVLSEESKQILPNEIHQNHINSESIPNTMSEIDTKSIENTLETETAKVMAREENVHSEDTLIKVEENQSIKETTLQNLESGMETMTLEQSNDSTVYMDLSNGAETAISELSPMEEKLQKVVTSCLETTGTEDNCELVKNESTIYLDLPNVIRETDEFLQSERTATSIELIDSLVASTPKNLTDDSRNSEQDNLEHLSETKIPDYGPGVTLTKLEQQCVPDFMSPFDSPSKSHPTDTYDENSSVVLGPFENCTIELFKGVKSTDLIDIPKEELFAFSSNFSEFDLETPSPLRDGNFLNEVPDIVNEDDLDARRDLTDPKTDVSDATDQSVTERRVSPSTPPNSPGYFLASTSQQKYLVDIDLTQPTEPPAEPDSGLSSLHKEIELNQIELQITSKLAMAENENNLNIEYSGPLTVEGVVQDGVQREGESEPEMLLAGNGDDMDDVRTRFALDEDCVTALRNELELKLPLAQVASIEPACESEKDDSWSDSLPPPPELIVNYPGALSPIAEETAPQLSAYENDAPYISARTESSESYPEPCDNSTNDASSLPTAQHTYTLSRAPADPTASEMTMSADSLNESPNKNAVDDRTFTLEDEKDACERLSQVSPFVLSPTEVPSDVTGVSTLSHTTLPKTSKPSETHCLSKATSIDSWCSNDTLYNVEEAFDDLASDPELPTDAELEHSESTHTLTEREPSHVSTYVIHSQSDEDRFSPDSITAQDAHTYTKPRTDLDTSPSVITKSEVNDSKTQTKDLAYGTLMSGVPSYSNCTTEVLSTDNGWLFPHPELVRRSPVETAEISATAPVEPKEIEPEQEPQLKKEPRLNKMDSVEISCLEDHLNFSPKNQSHEIDDSPNHYNMVGTTTSTPLAVIPADESADAIEVTPDQTRTPLDLPDTIPNFPSFYFSAELRAQNDSDAPDSLSNAALEDSAKLASESRVESYTEFRNAAIFMPQDTRMQSSQNNSDSYRQFENSVLNHPQESSRSPSALLLLAERAAADFTRPSPVRNEPTVTIIPPSNTNLKESPADKVKTVIITDLEEDETEQPHSIIIAEISNDNRTYESHADGEINHTYDSHPSRRKNEDAIKENNSDNSKELTINGLDDQSNNSENVDAKSPETSKGETKSVNSTNKIEAPNDSVSKMVVNALEKCNGNDEKFATVNFINESFEELLESNVDDSDSKDKTNDNLEIAMDDEVAPLKETTDRGNSKVSAVLQTNVNGVDGKAVAVTEDFLHNEKRFCELDTYLPLLSDIRFTGPASEIMSTSFTQASPTEPEREDAKEWDSDSDSHSTNSSSGEFIWKGGDGLETSVVSSTHFDHRGGGGAPAQRSASASGSASGSGSGSGSGSEGDEVEFVPSSWDCRAAPAKSSLRRLPDSPQDKKRVVFKRQKYHCVYEYPRELVTVDADSPAYLPDLSTYTDWEPASAEDAELGYGQLFGMPSPLDLYPLRGGFGTDYDEDFFISSSARPFESLGALTASQFFPGRRPPSPPRAADLATPDSGVEDSAPLYRPAPAGDSASSSEAHSPGSPEALGGLRHTRDKLKLDLPPSPHLPSPSPRHNRVFNFALDKPPRPPATPLVMTDETPLLNDPLLPPAQSDPLAEPTFSTFGKATQKAEPEQKMILTDAQDKPPSPVKVEPVKGEGTVLDSGDEDSGIESSSKATLERNTPAAKLEP